MKKLNLIEQRLMVAETLCKQNSAQLTPIRKALLAIIYGHNGYLTAYELLNLYRKTNPTAESMTIYRALNFLQKQQLIHRLESQNAYAACDLPHQEHLAYFLLCQKCNQLQEVRSLALTKAVKKLGSEHQFMILNKPIEITGICNSCQSA